ncbi:MAG: tetratricopeptide repeat protein [Pseudomonadota bacterium]
MFHYVATVTALLLLTVRAHALNVEALWEPGDPVASEARMRIALEAAQDDDKLIIRTQIARTYMFRKDFDAAREILKEIASDVGAAGPEAQVYYWLELGRSYASHQHPPGGQTDETRAIARGAYQAALAISNDAGLDGLSVDVLHMFAFVDTGPAQQLLWTRKALDVVLKSDQPAATRWEASIRSNLGEAYFDLTQYSEALEQFERALAVRERDGAASKTVRDAKWHIARTLRKLGQLDLALKMQQGIADEAYAENAQRHYIHDELSLLYAALDDPDRAHHYAEHSAALKH